MHKNSRYSLVALRVIKLQVQLELHPPQTVEELRAVMVEFMALLIEELDRRGQ